MSDKPEQQPAAHVDKAAETPVTVAKSEPASAKPAAKSSGTGLSLLALLIALAGAGAGGWAAWQEFQRQQVQAVAAEPEPDPALIAAQQTLQNQQQALASLQSELQQAVTQMPSQAGLSEQQAALAAVQQAQQQFDQRLSSLLDRSRQDWRLAEGEHLVRLASLRLQSLRDSQGATALLLAADNILREQDDPAAYGAREQLAKSIEALRMLPAIDRTGLFLQLSALREQLFALKPLPSDYDADAEPPLLAANDSDPEWKQWLSKLSAYVRIDVAAEESIRPLLAGESLEQVQLALSLTLQQAQWSVFNGDPAVYKDALKQAGRIIERYFPLEHAEVRNVRQRLKELAAQPVDVTLPSVADTLTAYQLYLAQRERKDLLLKPAPAAQPVEPAVQGGE